MPKEAVSVNARIGAPIMYVGQQFRAFLVPPIGKTYPSIRFSTPLLRATFNHAQARLAGATKPETQEYVSAKGISRHMAKKAKTKLSTGYGLSMPAALFTATGMINLLGNRAMQSMYQAVANKKHMMAKVGVGLAVALPFALTYLASRALSALPAGLGLALLPAAYVSKVGEMAVIGAAKRHERSRHARRKMPVDEAKIPLLDDLSMTADPHKKRGEADTIAAEAAVEAHLEALAKSIDALAKHIPPAVETDSKVPSVVSTDDDKAPLLPQSHDAKRGPFKIPRLTPLNK